VLYSFGVANIGIKVFNAKNKIKKMAINILNIENEDDKNKFIFNRSGIIWLDQAMGA
jgi:hypothetical protein